MTNELPVTEGGHDYPMGIEVSCRFKCGAALIQGQPLSQDSTVDPMGKCPNNYNKVKAVVERKSVEDEDSEVTIVKKSHDEVSVMSSYPAGELPTKENDLWSNKTKETLPRTPKTVIAPSTVHIPPPVDCSFNEQTTGIVLHDVKYTTDKKALLLTIRIKTTQIHSFLTLFSNANKQKAN